MPSPDQLSERELKVLEAVVQTYSETAEPAGSQTIARRFGLGVSPATIRHTMSELEDKGYLLYSVGVNGKDDDGVTLNELMGGDDLRVRMPLPEMRRK